MDVLEKLNALMDYYGSTRQMGHTTVMLEGTKAGDCLIMAHNHKYAHELVQQSGREKRRAINWASLNRNSLLGCGVPLAIDNGAIYHLCLEASGEITKSRRESLKATQRATTLEAERDKAVWEVVELRRWKETYQRLSGLQETYIAKLENDFKETLGEEE